MLGARQNALQKQEAELPDFAVLRSGAKFNPNEDRWRFQDGVHMVYVDFTSLPTEVAPLRLPLKRVLIDAFRNNSPAYATNLFYNFRRLAISMAASGRPVSEVNAEHILNFIGGLHGDDELGLESQLASLLARWLGLGVGGVAADGVAFLRARKKRGNLKGQAVANLDPIKGPFTDLELQELLASVTQAYAENRIDEYSFLLVWLIALTGQRPIQYCSLKVKDLRRVENESGVDFEIDIPRGKQRGELVRDSFLRRPLPNQLGQALWQYGQGVAYKHADMGVEAPLFPAKSKASRTNQINDHFRHHGTSSRLNDLVAGTLASLAPVSHRTGKPMHIAIGRFRDTLGTRAAQEGFGELVIAEMLGHVDTQNVKCYVAAIPEIAERLDRQLAKELAPIANAFRGQILRNRDEARRAGDPASEIVDYANSGRGVGACGSSYDCRFNAPLACYTCHNFEAWSDAPHSALLEHLLAERERLMRTSGARIASVNDRSILAIQAVVDACGRLNGSGQPQVQGIHG